jgi:hypothetical protein
MRWLLMTGVVCLLLGTAHAQDNRALPILPQQLGRYQILTNARNETFLLDTVSGQTWFLTQFTDFNKDPLAWVPVHRLDSSNDTTPLLNEYGLKPLKQRR